MNRYTGNSFRNAAKMLPRRATLSFGAPSARCTIYWSVHQYHSPMTGAQIAMPSHGKFWLKYHASLTTRPASFLTSVGAQVASTPAGTMGFHRLNMSEPQISRRRLQPPNSCKPKIVSSAEPPMRTQTWTASLYATARMPPSSV